MSELDVVISGSNNGPQSCGSYLKFDDDGELWTSIGPSGFSGVTGMKSALCTPSTQSLRHAELFFGGPFNIQPSMSTEDPRGTVVLVKKSKC